MRGVRDTDRNHRKFISITDTAMWEKIDEIMTLPEYSKSFNKVINDALFYGLDTLHESLFEVTAEKERVKPKRRQEQEQVTEEYFMRMVKLLQELIVNVQINKAIACSLFEAKSMELNGLRCRAERFDSGKCKDTPECFLADELQMLKEIEEVR